VYMYVCVCAGMCVHVLGVRICVSGVGYGLGVSYSYWTLGKTKETSQFVCVFVSRMVGCEIV